jgi:hypothetical protein
LKGSDAAGRIGCNLELGGAIKIVRSRWYDRAVPRDLFAHLEEYYRQVGRVLQGQAAAASIFPNPSDIGSSRERVYAAVLQQHLPANCRVFFGGFVFNHLGQESKQLDIIITSVKALQFNFHNPNGGGKCFASVEGCLGVVSVKSRLGAAELEDGLLNLASIPPQQPLHPGRVDPNFAVEDYEDWPFRILYATDGVAAETCQRAAINFYKDHPSIPIHRRVNMIHMAGKYAVLRSDQDFLLNGELVPRGTFGRVTVEPDVDALTFALVRLQKLAQSADRILFDMSYILEEFEKRRRATLGM